MSEAVVNGLKQIFEVVRGDAQAAAKLQPAWIDNAHEPHRRYLWNPITKEITPYDSPPADRKYRIDDFEDFCEAVNTLTARVAVERLPFDVPQDASPPKGKPAIFVNERGAFCVLDEPTRHETVALDLVQTAIWERLVALSCGAIEWLPHEAFVHMLKTDLRGAVDTAFMTKISDLRFTSSDVGGSTVMTGQHDWDRKVAQQAKIGGETVPEELTLAVFVFEQIQDAAVQAQIECTVLVKLSERKLALRPTRQSIEALRLATLRHIRDRIRAECPGALVAVGGGQRKE